METLIIHAEKEKLKMVEDFLKKLKIRFEKHPATNPDDLHYNPEFVEMIKSSETHGQFTEIDPKDVWGSLGLK